MMKTLLVTLLALSAPAFASPPEHLWDRRMQWQNFSRVSIALSVRAKMAMDSEAGTVTFQVTDPAKQSARVSRAFKAAETVSAIYPDDFGVDLTLVDGTFRWQAAVQGHVVRSGTLLVTTHSENGTMAITLTDDAFPAKKR